MSIYKTRNQGLAALLRYINGRDSHLRTYIEPSGSISFELSDPNGEARGIAKTYHGENGGGGFGVTDAKGLVEEFCEVRKTLTAAVHSGEWRNENSDK